MKKIIFTLLFAILLVGCSDKGDALLNTPEKLYIVSSKGAFGTVKPDTIKPRDAYVEITRLSSTNISLYVYYTWGYLGFMADIPSVPITGTTSDFTISATDLPARYKIKNLSRAEYQDMTMTLNGVYKKASGAPSFTLSITPHSSYFFPLLEIQEVSSQEVTLEPGGAISEWPANLLVFENHLSCPVSVKWEGDMMDETLTVDAGASKPCWSYTQSPLPSGAESPATLIKEGKEYQVDLFAKGRYTQEQATSYYFVSGGFDYNDYTKFTFKITPDLFE